MPRRSISCRRCAARRSRPIVEAACADLPEVRHRILLSDHAALFAGEEAGTLRETEPGDIVQIQYTSGTTGFPKGALLHQKGLIQNGFDTILRWGVEPGDRMLVIMPLFHTAGCALQVLGGLANGVTMMLAPGFDPELIARVIERERLEYLLGVPTMIVALIDEAERRRRDLTSVRSVMSGGSMVAPELVRKAALAFGAPIQIVYGQTETSPVITTAWRHDSEADLSGTIGQPLPHMDVAILDTADGSICPIGVQGEICCRGYNVMTGYNDNPEATAAGDRRRRLAAHRRPRHDGLARLPQDHRAGEGHDHPRRRESVSGRDRERHPRA